MVSVEKADIQFHHTLQLWADSPSEDRTPEDAEEPGTACGMPQAVRCEIETIAQLTRTSIICCLLY